MQKSIVVDNTILIENKWQIMMNTILIAINLNIIREIILKLIGNSPIYLTIINYSNYQDNYNCSWHNSSREYIK